MSRVNKKSGFTLIELTLAMTFISVLLLVIALTVIQIGNIYNKGLTMKDANQAGRSLTSELQRSISESTPFDLSTHYISDKAWGGRLCIGRYTYIWNYGKDIKNATKTKPADTSNLNAYKSPDDKTVINFIKVPDADASYCTKPTDSINKTGAIEMLTSGEHNLVVHSFSISASPLAGDYKTGQQLYSIKFEIGTNHTSGVAADDSLFLDNTGLMTCKAPGVSGADPSYCSVTQFNITALAGNYAQ